MHKVGELSVCIIQLALSCLLNLVIFGGKKALSYWFPVAGGSWDNVSS